jgi:hypothetical protein
VEELFCQNHFCIKCKSTDLFHFYGKTSHANAQFQMANHMKDMCLIWCFEFPNHLPLPVSFLNVQWKYCLISEVCCILSKPRFFYHVRESSPSLKLTWLMWRLSTWIP